MTSLLDANADKMRLAASEKIEMMSSVHNLYNNLKKIHHPAMTINRYLGSPMENCILGELCSPSSHFSCSYYL